MPTKKITPADLNDYDLFEFMNSGTRDYIASRILFRNGLSGQGAILAVTCFEKTLKTIVIKLGESFRADGKGHNLTPLVDKIKSQQPNFFSEDEEKFLRRINEAYRIRYLISEEDDFKIFLPSHIILVHLDNLYVRLIKSSPLHEISTDSKLFDMYEKNIMPKNHLVLNNCFYNNSEEARLISSNQWCDKYEHIKDHKTYSLKFQCYPGTKINQ
ncbi:MAG TPA: hypothetical protein PKD85_23385, partial [Saprospiraceae bacterium]|nr:hypothetical protein [Saprospiraceae bacterium]